MLGDKKNNIVVIVILSVILLLNIISFVQKDSARNLETIKVGGNENMKIVKEIYQSPSYVEQQTTAIEQALAQINMADQGIDNIPLEGVDQNYDETVNPEDVIMLEE